MCQTGLEQQLYPAPAGAQQLSPAPALFSFAAAPQTGLETADVVSTVAGCATTRLRCARSATSRPVASRSATSGWRQVRRQLRQLAAGTR